MSLRDRLSILCNALGLSVREFERQCGLNRGNISNMTGALGSDKLSKIIARYPEVNLYWLISGEGEIFKTKSTEILTVLNGKVKGKDLGKERKLQNSLPNDRGEISQTKTPKNATVVDGGEKGGIPKLQKTPPIERTETAPISTQILTDSEGYVEVPVVDIEAAAGGGAQNSDYMDEVENMRFPVSLLRPTKSKRLCINVAGESMEPTLFDGTQIVVRLLDRSEWGGIRSGDVYVVTNRSGETFIKRVRNKLRLQGVLVLTSDNPDQRRYRPFELSEEEIFNVWAVELMISDNIPPSDREIDDLRDRINDLQVLVERLAAREN